MLVLDFSFETVDLVHISVQSKQQCDVRTRCLDQNFKKQPNLRSLVVSSVQENPIRVKPLVGKKRQGHLDRPTSSVHKVSVEEKDVVG